MYDSSTNKDVQFSLSYKRNCRHYFGVRVRYIKQFISFSKSNALLKSAYSVKMYVLLINTYEHVYLLLAEIISFRQRTIFSHLFARRQRYSTQCQYRGCLCKLQVLLKFVYFSLERNLFVCCPKSLLHCHTPSGQILTPAPCVYAATV